MGVFTSHKKWRIFSLAIVLGLLGCTSAEHEAALVDYEKALAAKNIEKIVVALTQLNEISPTEYGKAFERANKASKAYNKAIALQLSGEDYQAYLSSHRAYRAWPAQDSKAMLVMTGKKVEWLLAVEKNLKKSYDLLPRNISILLDKYQNKSVTDWDLITINQYLEQLGKSSRALTKALKLIDEKESSHLILDENGWYQGINEQQKRVKGLSEHLINIAQYHSADELWKLNSHLVDKSKALLSQVESNLAQAEMKVRFQKAKEQYLPFTTLIENLSFASALGNGNRHAKWYVNWSNVELQVFTLNEPIEQHIQQNTSTVKLIESYRQLSMLVKPNIDEKLVNQQQFMAVYPSISSLLIKLNQDKTLISYGLSTSQYNR
ncbi:hypothetical protein [Litorilituus lipolyticus]|uniref:Uncharacterized protein n=1 Tax=Litorilituus lipolyticus TaxID=2491017 RepID=A0A502KZE4_9GAMM|nr:hypothetical protein [Litorilituus lipolyticus]TPH15535.1 hypothetical protein EPA86_08095 [Litorilituus lipolyticus]